MSEELYFRYMSIYKKTVRKNAYEKDYFRMDICNVNMKNIVRKDEKNILSGSMSRILSGSMSQVLPERMSRIL